PEQSCVRPALTGKGGISGEPDDTERVQSGSEGGRWKSTRGGNSLAAYPTSADGKAAHTGTEARKKPNGEVRQVSHGKDAKVREMRTAETILNIIQDRGKRQLPLDDVYRQLYNPDLYLRAYAKLYKNDGAMTPGTTGETVDGMSLDKIDRVIEAMRYERWKWSPAKRVYIDKPKGGKRPLGMP